MLLQRTLVVIILLPIGILAILTGGLWFTGLITLIITLASIEYAQLFKTGGFQPATWLISGSVIVLLASRYFSGFENDYWLLPTLILLSMAIHLFSYERGRDQAATDFAITIAGIFYLGYIGSYFISTRAFPNGQWWILILLPSGWLADSGAYFIGKRFGKHKLSPRLSPKKTWEGYFGGYLFSLIGTPLLILLYQQLGMPESSGITIQRGLIIALLMSIFPTLGDLGESMIKRQVGIKDSGKLLPGHGGFLDRIDSWLWMIIIGYHLVRWFFLS
jgi:phosphatidate cytidylyltransferase